MDVESVFKANIERFPPFKRLLIGLSGGLDSMVLLDLVARYWSHHPDLIQPLHIHHGLQRSADAWVEHCYFQAKQRGLDCQVIYVDARAKPGESPEEVARNARYQAFESLLQQPNTHLLLGQHADDQVETLFLQLFRGTGLSGLSAMPFCRPLGQGSLFRPLLNLKRSQLEHYANLRGLVWINDPSNDERRYDRNFLRHEVIPILKTRWPGLTSTLTRTSEQLAEAKILLNSYIQRDLATVKTRGFRSQTVIDIQRLKTFSPVQIKQMIKLWLEENNLRQPSATKLETVIKTVVFSRYDLTPTVIWQGVEVRRYRNHLYINPIKSELIPIIPIRWDLKRDLILPSNLGTLYKNDWLSIAEGRDLEIGFLQEKKQLYVNHLDGKPSHRMKLKDYLQAVGIPPWYRQAIPFIYAQGACLALGGFDSTQSLPILKPIPLFKRK